MPDIAKCGGVGCPIRSSCLRHTLPARDEWQSWMAPAWTGTDCENWWPTAQAINRMAAAAWITGDMAEARRIVIQQLRGDQCVTKS